VPFTLRVRVAPEDVDELNHVNNLVYLRWVQDAAVAHSDAVGLGLNAYLERKAAFVIRRHEIDYLRPALAGDEVDVQTQVAAVGPATAERRTEIRRASDGAVLARAMTLWAYMDLSNGRPVRIPADINARFPLEPYEEPKKK
jgi:acyl-CoA thioester hydrolase